MAAIEIFKPGMSIGNFAPCLAGGSAPNQFRHSSFIPAKSLGSERMKVVLTTSFIALPAAFKIVSIFFKHCRVCSWMVLPTTAPVSGSKGLDLPRISDRPFSRPDCRPAIAELHSS